MILLGRIYIKYIKFCVKYCIRNIINTKFQFQCPYIRLWQGTIHKESSSILVIFRHSLPMHTFEQQNGVIKAIDVRFCLDHPSPPQSVRTLYTQNTLFSPIGVCTSLGVTFSGLLYRHLFKRRQFTKMIWLNFFFISLHGSVVKSGKKCNMKKYFLFYVVFHAVEIK